VDDHVAEADVPLVEEHLQAGAAQVPGERVDPLAIGMRLGNENVPAIAALWIAGHDYSLQPRERLS
jgi:hypothetical protein